MYQSQAENSSLALYCWLNGCENFPTSKLVVGGESLCVLTNERGLPDHIWGLFGVKHFTLDSPSIVPTNLKLVGGEQLCVRTNGSGFKVILD